jgi:hypothetical protein
MVLRQRVMGALSVVRKFFCEGKEFDLGRCARLSPLSGRLCRLPNFP